MSYIPEQNIEVFITKLNNLLMVQLPLYVKEPPCNEM